MDIDSRRKRTSNNFIICHRQTISVWEDVMQDMNRRSALTLGLTAAAATPLLGLATSASAKEYGPTEGKELYPGIRLIDLGKRPSEISAYKTVHMLDVVFQPGAVFPVGEVMEADMV